MTAAVAAKAVPVTAQQITVTPLTGAIGADIAGVDLSQPLTDAEFEVIHGAWLQHLVLRFRGQTLDKELLLAFSRRFGKLDKAPINPTGKNWIEGYGELAVMSNIKQDGKPIGSLGDGEAVWHTDMSYQDITPSAALLYGVEVVQKDGGETGFTSMYRAYELMPDDLKQAIAGRQIKHDASYNSAGQLRKGFKEVTDPREAPGAVHPIVIRHPVTGRKALFLGRRPHAYVVGLPLEESEALLDRLWTYALDHANREHWFQKWKVGDLLLWDNRCTMHMRTAFDPAERRYLMRTTIIDGKPQAA
jgi:taurine dioxygenase